MNAKEMLQQLAVIFSSGDTSDVKELFSSEYIDHQRPEWMDKEGYEEFKAIVELARNSMPNLTVKIVGPIISEDNMIAARMNWTSENVERETIEILRIEDSKFIEHWGAEAWSRQKGQNRLF